MESRFLPLGLWFAAVGAFAVVGLLAAEHATFPLDIWATRNFQGLDSPLIALAVDIPEDLNDPPFVSIAWVTACLGTFFLFGWQPALLLAIWPIERVMNSLLKALIERPRPSDSLVKNAEHDPTTFSFPSGHAGATILLYGLLFYIATRYLTDTRMRLAAQAVCVYMIVGTGLQRIYAGHHWPSDVIGGFWFGGLMLAALIGLDQALIARRRHYESRPRER